MARVLPPRPIRLVAERDASGERLDRFLAQRIGTLSRSRVKSLIEAGAVHCDGRPHREPAAPVRAGTVYTLTLPVPQTARPAAEHMPLTILYEDADLIVIDKPAGLVVHPAPGNESGTLVNALIAHCGEQLTVGGEHRPGIVHRLDKDTSGVMVAAKTETAMLGLTAIFAARDLDRAYLALAWGVPTDAEGEIAGAVGRDPHDRKRMAVRRIGGKPALTRYRTRRAWFAGVSELECRLATGRTHQIRVHLASRGHPIVGDPVYLRRLPEAARRVPEPIRAALLDFPRQALHAARLSFAHPRSGRTLAFESVPPADMAALIAGLDHALRSPQC